MSRNRRGRRNRRLPEEPVEVVIEALSAEGRGIAHVDTRTVFIDQALVGEHVQFKYTSLKKNIAEGKVIEVMEASPDRVEPVCDAFINCGGCSLQHMRHEAQVTHKQKTLIEHLKHIGNVEAEIIMEPIIGPQTGYRNKARLGVRYVSKKERILVGFRERGSSFIAEADRCEVLHRTVGEHLHDIASCIDSLEIKQRIPQIEVAVGDDKTVLVFRHLEPIDENDKDKLKRLCETYGYVGYAQAGKPEDIELLWPENAEPLHYDLEDFGVRIEFAPTDFTQVNPDINRRMLNQAIDHLELEPSDEVLDLFCGLGNFSLPLATRCQSVTAVEGSLSMVQKARDNAISNKIENVNFVYGDLYSDKTLSEPWVSKKFDKVLLDPPRSGAAEVIGYFKKMNPQKIVYVSCQPTTLARDAGVIVNDLGYRLTHAGIMDMFPHTAHVESMAVFVRG